MVSAPVSRRKVAFALYPDETGHVNTSLTLAKRVARAGWEVTYIGLADDSEAIEKAGFRYFVLAPKAFPRGYFARMKSHVQRGGAFAQMRTFLASQTRALEEARDQLPAIRAEGFDVFLADAVNLYAVAIGLSSGARVALWHSTFSFENKSLPPLWSSYRHGSWIGRVRGAFPQRPARRLFEVVVERAYHLRERDILARLAPQAPWQSKQEVFDNLPNIVSCPFEFELPHEKRANYHYIDALIDAERSADPLNMPEVEASKRPLVFLSMGTQAWLLKRPGDFFRRMIEAARNAPWHLLVAIGRYADRDALGPLPPNVTIVERAPQLTVLDRASLMITHAGLNSVKECIRAGVPMIALPVGRDQPGNAARIEFHGLGRAANPRKVSTREIRALVDHVLGDASYKERVMRMSEHFRAAEERDLAVELVNQLAHAPLP